MKISLPTWAKADYDAFLETGHLGGQGVASIPLTPPEIGPMEEFICSHLRYLESWDGQADADPALGEVVNASFSASYEGDSQQGQLVLVEPAGYAEAARYSSGVAELVAFNREGGGWLFHVDRSRPERSFREVRR